MKKETKTNNSIKAVGYIRVSVSNEITDGMSLETQTQKIKDYCRLYKIDLISIKMDNGVSGKSTEGRGGLKEALEMIEEGKANCLIVSRTDRLSRNIVDMNYLIKKYFMDGNNKLISIDEMFDTKSPQGRAYVNLMMSFNTYEREIISLRIKEVLGHLRSKNVRYSNHTPYGKKLGKDGRLLKNKSELEAINLAKELRNQGISYGKIAKTLCLKGFMNRNGKEYKSIHILRMCNS